MAKFTAYDVIVVGAGHAGCEAALAAARLGTKTAVVTLSLDAIANMPCNPSIGGSAKGHIVHEIDCLGGEMGRAADATTIQSRTLNLAKGPAVHATRVQSDRRAYHRYMKAALEREKNLDILQDEVVAVVTDETGAVSGVRTLLGGEYPAKAVVIATGTSLKGRIFVGDTSRESGPDSTVAATKLSESLAALGIPLRRFKTGTPARIHRRSIDFSRLEVQQGDADIRAFCPENEGRVENKAVCYIAYTNERTHDVIRRNLHRSPLYGGKIEGVGPRYCPSIEDKVVRFADKPRHQLFIEPCGLDTDEMYLQGMSSSLPLDVQIEMYRTIDGLERAELMRPAYAIEYDCCDPLCLLPTLQVKTVAGLYGAGQFNGTSGYEEAAGQGLVAGINAARWVKGLSPLVLTRDNSYIGTLIDDLVTKGTNEPYRMMTSRSEHRLLLRQDNTDKRLCAIGREMGLVSEERYAQFLRDMERLAAEIRRMETTVIPPCDALNAMLREKGTTPITTGATVAALVKRPALGYEDIRPFDHGADAALPQRLRRRAVIELRYAGYLKLEQAAADKQKKLETTPIPDGFDYDGVRGLRIEARDKLKAVRPLSLGQAGRISGVNPADVAVLSVALEKEKHR